MKKKDVIEAGVFSLVVLAVGIYLITYDFEKTGLAIDVTVR